MKTKQDFIKYLIENFTISTHYFNNVPKFIIGSEKYNINDFIYGEWITEIDERSDKTITKFVDCVITKNPFLLHPDFKHLFTADIIKELVINHKFEVYTDYELTQNC